MTITITAFEASPDEGRGLARDARVRWALEEAGLAYEVRLMPYREMKAPAHLALNPFGQIPTYEDGEVALFESGAIVLHVARQSEALLPGAPAAEGRAISWLFAALNSVEPPIIEREAARLTEREEPWHDARLALMERRIHVRLGQLSAYLGDRDWLEDRFTVGDLMMVSVLLRLKSGELLEAHPTLAAYLARGEARPAYQRAFAAQLAVHEAATARGLSFFS